MRISLILALLISGTLHAQSRSSGSSGSGGSGTVTSVAATVPAFLSISGSPVTTSGTLALTLSGTALPIANGGTASTTASGALAALSGANTSLSNLSAVAINTDLILSTGAAAIIKTANAAGATKDLTLVSGTPSVDNVNSGAVSVSSAVATGTGLSGDISFLSGNTVTGTTGSLTIGSGHPSGNATTTGSVSILSSASASTAAGAATGSTSLATGGVNATGDGSHSGLISIGTGIAPGITNQASGSISVVTGTSGYQSGDISIGTGDGSAVDTGYSGDALLYTGQVTGIANSGHVRLHPGSVGVGGTKGSIKIEGHATTVGTAPGVSACGTNPSIAGTDVAGRVTVGSGVSTTSCTITFDQAWDNAAICAVSDETTSLLLKGVGAATTLTISAAASFSTNVIVYHCLGYQ